MDETMMWLDVKEKPSHLWLSTEVHVNKVDHNTKAQTLKRPYNLPDHVKLCVLCVRVCLCVCV